MSVSQIACFLIYFFLIHAKCFWQLELCFNKQLIDKWKRLVKKQLREARKEGKDFDVSKILEVNFLKKLVEEFLEVPL